MKNYTVTLKQFENMAHCIGFQQDRVRGRKNRRYEAFRNYFTTSDNDPEWDNLVEQGLAEKHPFPSGGGTNPQAYHVTLAGMEYLSRITGVLITEME